MKYRMDEESIIDKIDKSSLIPDDKMADEELKSILKKTMQELCRYTEDVFKNIEDKVLTPMGLGEIGEIVSALVVGRNLNQDKKCHGDLTRIYRPGSFGNVYFIDASYEEVRNIVGDIDYEKTFEGRYINAGVVNKFRYRLVFDNRYLWAQEMLWRMASIYKVENMIIYSPYMRKAFKIEFLDEIPDKAKDIDPLFEQNGIPAISDAELLCNMQIEATDLLKATCKVPYGEDVKYIYHFDKSKDGNLRYPIPQNNQTIVYDVKCMDDGIEIVLDHELEEFLLVECRKISWDSLEIKKLAKDNKIFTNHIERGALPVRRIISEGDIEYAIHPFRNNRGVKCEIAEKLEKVCTRYSAKYRSQGYNRMGYRKIKHVNLKFTSEDGLVFYDDYINYVLLFLECYYPEVEWCGGR